VLLGMHQSSVLSRTNCIIGVDCLHYSFDEDGILKHPDGLLYCQPTLLVHNKQINSTLISFELPHHQWLIKPPSCSSDSIVSGQFNP
jgi:hypothetical protein